MNGSHENEYHRLSEIYWRLNSLGALLVAISFGAFTGVLFVWSLYVSPMIR